MSGNHSDKNQTLLDIANEPQIHLKVVLFGYITPIFFLITLAANVMIVLCLSRPSMQSPTNLVLLAMAVADLLTLVFPVPWYFYMYTLGNYKFYLYPSLSCNLYYVMSEILPNFFHTASIWCTLLLACQRYIYICHPTTAKVWCTNQRVTRAILVTFFLAFIHQLLRFFELHYENTFVLLSPVIGPTTTITELDDNNEISRQKPACRLVMASWITSFEDLYFGSYFIFRIMFVHIGPCLLLVIFNVLLYNALKQAEKTRKKLLNKNDNQSNSSSTINQSVHQQQASDARKANRGRDANSTTVMLIVIVTVFLTVEIPLAVATAVHVTENTFNVDLVSDHYLYMTIIFSNFFIIISYPFNFAIYCGMSRAFRETFQQMFLPNIFTTGRNGHTTSTLTAFNTSNNLTQTTTASINKTMAIRSHQSHSATTNEHNAKLQPTNLTAVTNEVSISQMDRNEQTNLPNVNDDEVTIHQHNAQTRMVNTDNINNNNSPVKQTVHSSTSIHSHIVVLGHNSKETMV